MTGLGTSYQESQRGRIQCKEFGEYMALGLLAGHSQTQYGRLAEVRRSWEATSPGKEPRTYSIAFLAARGPQNCPVEGCLGRAATRMAIRVHFFHGHVQDTVIIL